GHVYDELWRQKSNIEHGRKYTMMQDHFLGYDGVFLADYTIRKRFFPNNVVVNTEFLHSQISIVVANMGRGSPPARETTWLYQAENFIRRTYPDLKTRNTTHLFPPVQYKNEWIKSARTRRGKTERSLILRLHQLGQRNRSSIFITYNSDFVHLIKTRNVGGGIEGILESEGHDIVLIHRNFGAILIQIKNLNPEKTEKGVGDATKNIKTAAKQLEMKIRSVSATRIKLENAMRECGLENINVSLSVIALPTVKREWVHERPSGVGLVFLCEEDCSSAKSLEEWWQKHILQSEHLQSFTIKDETYISLLAIYIAPAYATPAFTARFNRQNLSFLTKDKLDILVNGPKEFVLKGAAGTGKTWIVQEKIRNIVMSWFSRGPIEDKNERILLIRRNTHVANKLWRTLYDLLFTSAMAELRKWIKGTNDEEERKKVWGILKKNVIICCLQSSTTLWDLQWEELKITYCLESQEGKADENYEPPSNHVGLTLNISMWKNASWEIFLCYEFLRSCMATFEPGLNVAEKWTEAVRKAGSLFESFTPSTDAMQNLVRSVQSLAKEMQSIKITQHSREREMIHVALTTLRILLQKLNAYIKDLSESAQHVILEDLHEVFKTQKPPFDHMFVDDGEEWYKSYGDHWLTMLRSLHKGRGGYFWRTYRRTYRRPFPMQWKN
ncbi:unnamed protein product, partial [Darwinula stevensoni]